MTRVNNSCKHLRHRVHKFQLFFIDTKCSIRKRSHDINFTYEQLISLFFGIENAMKNHIKWAIRVMEENHSNVSICNFHGSIKLPFDFLLAIVLVRDWLSFCHRRNEKNYSKKALLRVKIEVIYLWWTGKKNNILNKLKST